MVTGVQRAGQLGVCALLVLGSLLAGEVSADPLSVMTVNLWHKDRPEELKIVAERLRKDLAQVPDFILCQEVVFRRSGELKNTAEVLAMNLGYHARGTKRTSDREGIAIVSKYPFTHYAERHLKHQTSRLLIGFRRVSAMGEFDVPSIGRVRVVNVHFTNWGFEAHIRRKQLAETLAWIEQRQKEAPAAVTFLGGDFNAKIDWDEMDQVKRTVDSVVYRNHNGDEPSMGPVGRPNKRIDFIFVASPDRPVRLVEEKLLWKNGLPKGDSRFFLSDHLAVVHSYQFAESPGQGVTSIAE